MKLTVLLDNNTLIDQYFLGEPGVSYFLDDNGTRILFDAGYSDAFLQNARRLSIDLLDLDYIVLSHGHLDHTWGLVHLVRAYAESVQRGRHAEKPTLVAHPLVFSPRRLSRGTNVGSKLSEADLASHFRLELSREPVPLTDRLTFLGEIPRTNAFEAKKPLGKIEIAGTEHDDFIMDDSALAYRSSQGLVIVTGCSHAGICNIVDHAKMIWGDNHVADIVGGLHLQTPPAEQLEGTLAYMESLSPAGIHACHCTDLNSKIALSKVVDLHEVGVGLTLEY